jgi:hypothetical protein
MTKQDVKNEINRLLELMREVGPKEWLSEMIAEWEKIEKGL